ncbi:lipase 1-like [Schistocerca cancellata]|uniref:lipase 1-like n=1 Tax=Schistocerca cancellata TaxID=274614 RepID=UPI0021186043|nr:lipase 1-like [Schistocerca cancellata]
MALWLGTATLVVLLQVHSSRLQQDYEYDSYDKTVAAIEKCGFAGERHEVTSRDGYSTIVFRMRQGGDGSGGQPVLLQHGFLSSSDSWFQLEANSLPCLLAADGYDVWLSNARGNTYSRAHRTLSSETIRFWMFSFHEMAVYDTAATIDYILSLSQTDQVSYVGHSMGGTLIFVLLSMRPEYNRKVDVAVSFAPVCFMGHTTSHLLNLLAYTAPYFEKPLNWLTNGEIPPYPDPQGSSTDSFNFQIGAALGEVFDFERMLQREMMMDSEPSEFLTDGSSLRTALHLAQLITRGE